MKKRYNLEIPPFSKWVICEPSELEDYKEEFADWVGGLLPENVMVEEDGTEKALHGQLTTTSPVAIKLGQKRLHLSAQCFHPWHRLTQNVQCPDCKIVFSVTEGFPIEQFLQVLRRNHQEREEHPDFVHSAPEQPKIADCDCDKF